MPILNYTTKISPEKTISEIQARLVKSGAKRLSFEYDDDGCLASLLFTMDLPGGVVHFVITPNIPGVLSAMQNDTTIPKKGQNKEQATRVAWRIEKDWLEAQLAKIEAGLATPLQLLLPYAVANEGQTFYQIIAQGNGPKLLK